MVFQDFGLGDFFSQVLFFAETHRDKIAVRTNNNFNFAKPIENIIVIRNLVPGSNFTFCKKELLGFSFQ